MCDHARMDEITEGWTLTPHQAAQLLGVSPDTVKVWGDKGKIPCWRTPTGHRRYRRSDIDAIIALGRV